MKAHAKRAVKSLVTHKIYLEALQEVRSTTRKQIEHATAVKWAARAIACKAIFLETGDQKWLEWADDCRHEALEHAALKQDHGVTVGLVEAEINRQVSRTNRHAARRLLRASPRPRAPRSPAS